MRYIKEICIYYWIWFRDIPRVDMAASLVKNDPESKGSIERWQDIRAFLDREFPNAAMVSEWGEPDKS